MSGEAGASPKRYTLVGADGAPYSSATPGTLGGNRRQKIYGRLDCPTALRALARGATYAKHRVFFADEETAIAAGYRPCGRCLRDRYAQWKRGPVGGDYPWRARAADAATVLNRPAGPPRTPSPRSRRSRTSGQ